MKTRPSQTEFLVWKSIPITHPRYLADSFSRYLRVEGILFTLNSKLLIKYVYAWLNQNILHFKQSLTNLCLKLSTLNLIKSLGKGYRNFLQLNVLLEAQFFVKFRRWFYVIVVVLCKLQFQVRNARSLATNYRISCISYGIHGIFLSINISLIIERDRPFRHLKISVISCWIFLILMFTKSSLLKNLS